MARPKKDKILSFNYSFFPGKYIIGDPNNLFEEKEANKIIKHINKSKDLFGYDTKYNLYYFKLKQSTKIDDYVDNIKPLNVPSKILVVSTHAKDGKLYGIIRINVKQTFNVYGDYNDDILYLYLHYFKEPGPFAMYSEIVYNSK